MRTAALTGLALAVAACGKSKPAAPACDQAQLAAARARFATLAERVNASIDRPHTLGADGRGLTSGAVPLRFIDAGDVQVQVGDLTMTAGDLGSTQLVLDRLSAALAGAPVKLVELHVFAALSTVPIHAILTRLDPAVEVHLVVDVLAAPPGDAAPWARELFSGLLAIRGDQRIDRLGDALTRAIGPTCQRILGAGDARATADLSIDALTACGCQGADVPTLAWLHELILYPTYEPAWLRLKVDTGGLRLVDMRSMQEVAGALETMTPAERQKGVWFAP